MNKHDCDKHKREKDTVINVIPDTLFVDYLISTISPVVKDIKDPELLEETKKLADEVRYSDPVSGIVASDIEDAICHNTSVFIGCIKEANIKDALEICKGLRSALRMRNMVIKQTKL